MGHQDEPKTDCDVSNYKVQKALDPGSAHTHRGLKPRHVQLAAIAGGIGVGLFVGIGKVLVNAGPLSLLLGYLIYGIGFIWPCNLCTAEMVTWLPIRGSVFGLASRYVDPALGFALGWTYFYAGAMFVCTETSAVATVVQFWVRKAGVQCGGFCCCCCASGNQKTSIHLTISESRVHC